MEFKKVKTVTNVPFNEAKHATLFALYKQAVNNGFSKEKLFVRETSFRLIDETLYVVKQCLVYQHKSLYLEIELRGDKFGFKLPETPIENLDDLDITENRFYDRKKIENFIILAYQKNELNDKARKTDNKDLKEKIMNKFYPNKMDAIEEDFKVFKTAQNHFITSYLSDFYAFIEQFKIDEEFEVINEINGTIIDYPLIRMVDKIFAYDFSLKTKVALSKSDTSDLSKVVEEDIESFTVKSFTTQKIELTILNDIKDLTKEKAFELRKAVEKIVA